VSGRPLPRERVRRTAQTLWRRALLARGTDVTAAVTERSCLVLAPHPDDESLGCGATIARKRTAGTRVTVAFAADGRSSHPASRQVSADELARRRAAEGRRACRILGVPDAEVHVLGLPDRTLAARQAELTRCLDQLIAAVAPAEILVASHLDHNVDHQALAQALYAGQQWRRPGLLVAEYPVWFWADGPWRLREGRRSLRARLSSFAADPMIALRDLRPWLVDTSGFLALKREAIMAHSTQTENVTGEEDWQILGDTFISDFLRPVEVFFPVPSPLGAR
jgi:LmbE family N-acetylglucosaminyl deacetylase